MLLAQCKKSVNLDRNLSCHKVSVTEIGSNKIANHHFVIEKSVEDTKRLHKSISIRN